jgi:hypothetical protein
MEDNIYPGLAEALTEHLKRKIGKPKTEPSSGTTQTSGNSHPNGTYDRAPLPVSGKLGSKPQQGAELPTVRYEVRCV